jgi:hypothetical protein
VCNDRQTGCGIERPHVEVSGSVYNRKCYVIVKRDSLGNSGGNIQFCKEWMVEGICTVKEYIQFCKECIVVRQLRSEI